MTEGEIFSLSGEGRVFIKKQIATISKGWYFYLPLALFVYSTLIIDRWDGNLLKHLIIGSLTLGLTLVYTFGIIPNARIKVIGRIIFCISIKDDQISFVTYPAFWKKYRRITIRRGDYHLFEHANDRGTDLYDQSPTYRLHLISTGEQFFLLGSYFNNWQHLFAVLNSNKYQIS